MADDIKSETLRLADALQQQAVWEGHYGPSYLRDLLPEAAAELRRLHAQREALRAELKEATEAINDPAVNNLRTLPESIRVLCAQRDALLEALKELMEYAGIIEERCDTVATNKARAVIKAVEDGK